VDSLVERWTPFSHIGLLGGRHIPQPDFFRGPRVPWRLFNIVVAFCRFPGCFGGLPPPPAGLTKSLLIRQALSPAHPTPAPSRIDLVFHEFVRVLFFFHWAVQLLLLNGLMFFGQGPGPMRPPPKFDKFGLFLPVNGPFARRPTVSP